MSVALHAPCIFSTTGDCATEIIGKPVIAVPAAAAVAPVKNLRRDLAGSFSVAALVTFSLSIASSVLCCCWGEIMLTVLRRSRYAAATFLDFYYVEKPTTLQQSYTPGQTKASFR